MALRALTTFGARDTNRDLYNIEVQVEATSMGNFRENVLLNQKNWMNLQSIEVCIPTPPSPPPNSPQERGMYSHPSLTQC